MSNRRDTEKAAERGPWMAVWSVAAHRYEVLETRPPYGERTAFSRDEAVRMAARLNREAGG
jgi:hypothetical protein